MTARKTAAARYAVCVRNDGYPASLELHKLYRVLRDVSAERDGDLRVIDESGEDYLYPADCFVIVPVPDTVARSLRKSFARGA